MYSADERTAPLFLFGSALLWSLVGVFTKSFAWDSLCLAALKGTLAFAGAWFLVRNRKLKLTRIKAITAVCYFVQGLLFVFANKYTTSANATVLQNMSPLYIILFDALLNKHFPTKKEITVCAVLFLGIILAFAGNMAGGQMLGNICAIVSALFYAGVYFFNKQEGADPEESLFWGNAPYLLLLPMMLTNETVQQTGAKDWALLILLAFLTGFCAWFCFSIGIKKTTALQASFITLSEPVMAPIFAYIFLKESISTLSLIGCVIVIGTLLVYNVDKVKSSAAA